MRHRPGRGTPRRQGYTLLEVILAAFITVLLMAGLYVALNAQYRHADAGREIVEQSTLAQGLLNRIANDILGQIAPPLPNNSASSSNPSGGGGSSTPAASSSTPATTPTAGTSTTGSGSSPTGTDPASAPNSTDGTQSNSVTFNLGVQGSSTQLTLYVSRVPRELTGTADNQAVVSDLRRISYWMTPRGLARQEVKQATSDDATVTMPPDVPNAESLVISDRVKEVRFEYWDGSSWQDSWDGTLPSSQPNSDGVTPQGPPMVIRIELKIAPASGAGADDSKSWKVYRHLVPIPTANRLTQPTNQ